MPKSTAALFNQILAMIKELVNISLLWDGLPMMRWAPYDEMGWKADAENIFA